MSAVPYTETTAAEQARSLLGRAEARECTTLNSNGYYREDFSATALRDAQAAQGHALLAIAHELAELRSEVRQAAVGQELADLAAAVRELTSTLASAAAPLPEAVRHLDAIATAANELAGLAPGLADIATETAGVAAAVDDLPRRRGWFRRGRQARQRLSADALTNQLGDTLIRAAELLDREGWDARGVIGRDVMMAVSRITQASPRSPYRSELCTRAWNAMVEHLDGQPLTQWQRELSRTQAQVVAMLREVAAKVTASELPSGAREV